VPWSSSGIGPAGCLASPVDLCQEDGLHGPSVGLYSQQQGGLPASDPSIRVLYGGSKPNKKASGRFIVGMIISICLLVLTFFLNNNVFLVSLFVCLFPSLNHEDWRGLRLILRLEGLNGLDEDFDLQYRPFQSPPTHLVLDLPFKIKIKGIGEC
jgi:hypothetical protein